jgi:hypothetical protein
VFIPDNAKCERMSNDNTPGNSLMAVDLEDVDNTEFKTARKLSEVDEAIMDKVGTDDALW